MTSCHGGTFLIRPAAKSWEAVRWTRKGRKSYRPIRLCVEMQSAVDFQTPSWRVKETELLGAAMRGSLQY